MARWITGLLVAGLMSAGAASAGTGLAPWMTRYVAAKMKSAPSQDSAATVVAATLPPGDNHGEIAVMYVQGRDWCGSGGCTLFIVERKDGFYKTLGTTTITRPPVRVLGTSSHGYPDLAVWVEGGGNAPGCEARLRFDGHHYPGNPSAPPAKPLGRQVPGWTLIKADVKGDPVFP